ncbi:MAG: hypothetical protein JRF45_04535 [Deltaproteobacteria bacterium]|nr:hypothetical protein [Deltaproteobacteria bacterium]MBW2325760.1 hypothetical protein [Deltaproteobacteria bacterium]
MNAYQIEQADTLDMVCRHFGTISDQKRLALLSQISDYLLFRDAVDAFLREHFENTCTQNCYQSRVSACCSREGIITFFGDVVVNALVSGEAEIKGLATVLQTPNTGFKCIYLGEQGCLWRIKPIVCEMFLCEQAQKEVFGLKSWADKLWQELKRREKLYRWPDRPVLFDDLERYFMARGYSSPLMYLHNSPGLLRVKKRARERKTSK